MSRKHAKRCNGIADETSPKHKDQEDNGGKYGRDAANAFSSIYLGIHAMTSLQCRNAAKGDSVFWGHSFPYHIVLRHCGCLKCSRAALVRTGSQDNSVSGCPYQSGGKKRTLCPTPRWRQTFVNQHSTTIGLKAPSVGFQPPLALAVLNRLKINKCEFRS